MVHEGVSAATGGAVTDLEVRGIAKRFGQVVAIERVDIDVQRGEFVAIMGPSGCGKTTLLRIIAGLERADEGTLLLRGDDISDVPVHKRSTRLIWQDYSLFPFLNVRKNIEFGLTLRASRQEGWCAARSRPWRSRSTWATCSRAASASSAAARSSGSPSPELSLPSRRSCSSTSRSARSTRTCGIKVQSELTVLQRELGISFIYVTHNQSEAFAMADQGGGDEQGGGGAGRPAGRRSTIVPATHFVAEFVGANNIFEGRVSDRADGAVLGRLQPRPGAHHAGHRSDVDRGAAVELVVQADKLRRRQDGEDGQNAIRAVLKGREFTGSQVIYYLETAQGVEVKMVLQEPFTEGEGTEINYRDGALLGAGGHRHPRAPGRPSAFRENGLRSTPR